jgi:transposase InsO family protein
MAAFMPKASSRALADSFNRRFITRGMTICKSTVNLWLRKDRYCVLQLRREMKRRKPRPLRKNAVWGVDMTGKRDAQGTTHMVLGCIDHGTRKCLALEVLPNKNAWTLLGYLFLAIGQFGKPDAVRTDNEACFTSRVFTAALRLAGIRHQRSALGCPWQNGRIERLFGTLKQKLNVIRPVSKEALQGLLGEFRFWYDAVRPHQNLGGATPREVWDGIDPWTKSVQEEILFVGWAGMLTGYYLRR